MTREGPIFLTRALHFGENFRNEPLTLYFPGAPKPSREQPNLIQAYKWFNLAVAANVPKAGDYRDEVISYMTPESLSVGQQLSSAFVPAKPTPLNIFSQPTVKLNHSDTNKIAQNQDDIKLLTWQRRQATNDDAYCQFQLGKRYLAGLGVETNLTLARLWLTRAAANSYAPAAKLLESLPVPAK